MEVFFAITFSTLLLGWIALTLDFVWKHRKK